MTLRIADPFLSSPIDFFFIFDKSPRDSVQIPKKKNIQISNPLHQSKCCKKNAPTQKNNKIGSGIVSQIKRSIPDLRSGRHQPLDNRFGKRLIECAEECD